MKNLNHVLIAFVAALLTGCLAGENRQFFENQNGADNSLGLNTSNPLEPPSGSTNNPNPPAPPAPTSTPNSDLCTINPNAAACDETPVVSTPGVVTILFTMSQIPQGAASLILANGIKYASPVANPKILFLKDSATNGEDEGDPTYIKNTLLAGYNVQYNEILPGGINASDIAGADLVIISNPGYPLSDKNTLATLKAFKGGVILIGDDMAHGAGFDISSLTGLTFQDNGTSMSCGGKTYNYDNLAGYSYHITMEEEFFAGIPDSAKNYTYGNDLDWTTAGANVQVLAWATAAPGTCNIGEVPAVVRHER